MDRKSNSFLGAADEIGIKMMQPEIWNFDTMHPSVSLDAIFNDRNFEPL